MIHKIKLVKSSKKLKKLLLRDLFHKIAGLSKTQIRILNYFIYMASRVRSMYMSQSHIALVAGCTREWANKCIVLLSGLNLIYSKHRNYYYGFRTNLYALKINFFKGEIAHELFTILSSLRSFAKQFTQLENVKHIITSTTTTTTLNQSKKPPNQEPPDVMNMTLADIMALRSPKRQISVPTPTQGVNRARVSGFKRIGDCL